MVFEKLSKLLTSQILSFWLKFLTQMLPSSDHTFGPELCTKQFDLIYQNLEVKQSYLGNHFGPDNFSFVEHLPGCGTVRLPPHFVLLFLAFLITVWFCGIFLPKTYKTSDTDCDHNPLTLLGRKEIPFQLLGLHLQ